ncbi:MAG TPA: DUF3551 domain-containing protein [Xanthobacteraceae bacterium]|jgi:hypothetical protein
MRFLFVLLGLLAGAALGTPAQAQNYPWCAYYSGRSGGGTNCGFTTFEQCLATVSGIGGFCQRNTQYVPPPGPHRTYRQRSY